MATNLTDHKLRIDFVFADGNQVAYRVKLSDSIITDIEIDSGPPELHIKCSLYDLFGINASLFTQDVFPYRNLWIRFAQLVAAEKHIHYSVLAETEWLRIIVFEYLKIAENLFCLATFSLNTGLNEIYKDTMQLYESLRIFFEMIMGELRLLDVICGTRLFRDLPLGFIERNFNFLGKLKLQAEGIFNHLIRNRIIETRCRRIRPDFTQKPGPVKQDSNQDMVAGGTQIQHLLSDLYHPILPFAPVEILKTPNPVWSIIKNRCENSFTSIHLIRTALQKIAYEKFSDQCASIPSTIPKGQTDSIIDSPWGSLICQMYCPGGKEFCEFILINPENEILFRLQQMAIGNDLSDLPILVASLGLSLKTIFI